MSKRNATALIDEAVINEAVERAARVGENGHDEFTQWLEAFLHINDHLQHTLSVEEIFAAWQDFQNFQG